jgi:hypothetical protein
MRILWVLGVVVLVVMLASCGKKKGGFDLDVDVDWGIEEMDVVTTGTSK